jgi:hypothetical protein
MEAAFAQISRPASAAVLHMISHDARAAGPGAMLKGTQ